MIAQRWVPFAALLAGATQRYALIHRHVVADDRGFANHHAHPVINKQAATQRCARMNLDAGDPARPLRKEARHKGNISPPQQMRQPMKLHGVKTRIQQHLGPRTRRRIVVHNRANIFAQR